MLAPFFSSSCTASRSPRITAMCRELSPASTTMQQKKSHNKHYLINGHCTLFIFFFFFLFIRWKLQSPQWRWQCIAGPSGFRTACGLQECGLARFPFWVACRWGRTAVDVLLSDCQYRKGTAPYGQCGVWNIGDSWGGCGLSWVWTLSLVPVWLTGSRGQPCCTVGTWLFIFKTEGTWDVIVVKRYLLNAHSDLYQ